AHGRLRASPARRAGDRHNGGRFDPRIRVPLLRRNRRARRLNNRWRPWPTVVAIVSAIVPYATIPAELWLARSGRLAGQWRTDEPTDPAERRWYDGLLRWFLRRPWVLAVLIVLAVVVLFTVLLIIGPPGGR